MITHCRFLDAPFDTAVTLLAQGVHVFKYRHTFGDDFLLLGVLRDALLMVPLTLHSMLAAGIVGVRVAQVQQALTRIRP